MNPPWLETAIKEVGVAEFEGNRNNPRIVQYLKAVEGNTVLTDSTPWCSAFPEFCFNEHGIEGPNSLIARKWLDWGIKLNIPVVGCICVLSSLYHVWAGHAGFWFFESLESVLLLSGNCDNRVKFKLFPKEHILGYRWPSHISMSDLLLKT